MRKIENNYAVTKLIIISALIAVNFSLFFFNFAVGQELKQQDVFQFLLNYDKGAVSLDNIWVRKIFYREFETQKGDYRLELISFDEQKLYERKFDFHLDIADAPISRLEQAIEELAIPYFENAKIINIYDKNGKNVLAIDVAPFAKVCGNNVCEPHESAFDCPKDCSKAGKDDWCNPEFLEKDPDCHGVSPVEKERIGISQKKWRKIDFTNKSFMTIGGIVLIFIISAATVIIILRKRQKAKILRKPINLIPEDLIKQQEEQQNKNEIK